ncbi:AMP-binding protein [Levilactobacillus fujinensis]|uniref:AMP-binding protein n=1 Tax=Levilactobacillus fujinensis TaxID=2486024 RepID=A0ABW1TEQ2_9LACO
MSNLTTELKQQLTTENPRVMQDADENWHSAHQLEGLRQQWHRFWNDAGIGYGDTVLVSLPNSVANILLLQTLWECGIQVHSINAATPSNRRATLDAQYHYAALLTTPNQDRLVGNFTTALLPTLDLPNLQVATRNAHTDHTAKLPAEDDIAVIMHTSGTTGKPKRVGLTHGNLYACAQNIITSERLTNSDKSLLVMPLFHVNALVISTLATRLSGGQLLVRPRFSAHRFWHDMAVNAVTWASLTPAIIAILLQHDEVPADLPNLRFLRSASAPLPPSMHAAFDQRFHLPLIESYGMTEAASQITQNPLNAPHQGSVGQVTGDEIQLLDAHHRPVAPGKTGEIALRGANVITHYLDEQPDAFTVDGWLLTGDLGWLDPDNYLHLIGRSKEMIIRGGENVNPLVVENELRQLPFVKEVAVVGLPDTIYGETVTAIVVPTGHGDAATKTARLQAIAKARLLPAEQPTTYLFQTALPKNATGKIQRSALKKQLTAAKTA